MAESSGIVSCKNGTNCENRCFGDKGDVEDITEGNSTITFQGTKYKPSNPTDHAVADIISTVEFDQTGNYLATGDKGGRVVLFERNETVCPPIWCSINLCALNIS